MDNTELKDLIFSEFIEPTFFLNFYKIARLTKDKPHRIQKTNDLSCWKIENVKLIKADNEHTGILFDGESYIVQWCFDFQADDQIVEEKLVYYWKGQHALKGLTPLPPELEENCPVERIVQWSEPAIFFYPFQKYIVFNGKECDFDNNAPHLLLARGELPEEIHFYEVPCKKVSLRTKATFLLIIPQKKCFLYWYGSQMLNEQRKKILEAQPHNYLRKWQKSWSEFSVHEQEEDHETNIFLDTVPGEHLDFTRIKIKKNFSPKLFYLNTITGTFLATPVEYTLRAKGEIAAFPFLQSHLYTALQPALFLLDNGNELWLWEGTKTSDCDNKAFEEELSLAKQFQNKYAELKEQITAQTVNCFHIHACGEPLEFKNIFPMWVDS